MPFNRSMLYPSGQEERQTCFAIVIEIICLAIVWCTGVLGNVLVCFVIYRSRRVQSTTNYFVMACASADLLFALLTAPFFAGRIISNEWLVGDWMCRFVRFVQTAMPSLVMYVVMSIGIDRYYTIIYPLSFKVTRSTAKRMIFVAIIAACVFSSYCFYFYDTVPIAARNGSKRLHCPTFMDPTDRIWEIFTLLTFVVQYLAPVILTAVIHIRLFRFIWRPGATFMRFQRTTNYVPRTKVKMVKMLMVMTLVTIVFLLPHYFSQIWVPIKKPSFVHSSVFIVSMWMALCTTTAKPIIYLCYNSNFRRGCKEILCMSNSKCYRSNTYAITTTSSFGKNNHVGVMRSDSQSQLNSPSKVFNRSLHADKSAWPIQNGTSTTYI